MYTFHLSPRKVTLILLVIVTALLLGGVATQYIKYVHGDDTQFGLVRLLNLEGENNLPSWYASVTLLLTSAALAIIGLYRKQQANAYGWHWLALAILFLGLSVDEAASIHEMADQPIHDWLAASAYRDSVIPVIGAAWLLAGILFAVIVFLVFWRFLLHLPRATRALFLVAGGLYIGGAIGLEAVGGRYLVQHDGSHSLTYEMMVAVEEGLEMFGVVLFLYALMLYMEMEGIGFQVVVNSGAPSGRAV